MQTARAWGFLAAFVLVACLPDQGAPFVPDGGTDGQVADVGPGDDGGDDGPTEAAAASENVMVVGVNMKFWFTDKDTGLPTGADPNTFYIKAGTLVHFTLQTSPNEESHTFEILIPNYTTSVIKMGQPGSEAHLDWTAPTTAGTYSAASRTNGIICTVHSNMMSDVVVAP